MKVTVKEFNVEMEVKTNGIEFEVRSPDGKKHFGDLVLTKTALIWCPGRTTPEKGVKKSWEEFIKMMSGEDFDALSALD